MDFRDYLINFGYINTFKIALKKYFNIHSNLLLEWNGYKIKGNTITDANATYDEVLLQKVYEFNLGTIENVVDLGANIGITSIFFNYTYPNAKIYCIEPDKRNCTYLFENVKSFANILTTPIWYRNKKLKLIPGKSTTINYYIENKEGVVSLTMWDVLYTFSLEKIDLLKIDIEGAEHELLTINNDWLNKVNNILIEFHKDYKTIFNTLDILAQKGFIVIKINNNIYWLKKV